MVAVRQPSEHRSGVSLFTRHDQKENRGKHMARKLDVIIVVDLEATCWEGDPPPGQEKEIIEIGVCTLDIASGTRSDKQSILVRPETSWVSEFCTRLTTLTQEQIDRERERVREDLFKRA